MTETRLPNVAATDTRLARDIVSAVRYYLGGRRGLLVLAGSILVAGLALNWGWLVAAGIAPLLVAALPCVAMCALGLCMNRTKGNSCSTERTSREFGESTSDGATPSPLAEAPKLADAAPAGRAKPAVAAMASATPHPQMDHERRNSDA